ncbi:VWA domain-containing protein, partial [Streptomyces antimycoticus]|uniref:VWA domain-containing protein n=1 Tax=Streptomyces antimycoticus TaxID=68175 RepID=UPI0033C4EB62
PAPETAEPVAETAASSVETAVAEPEAETANPAPETDEPEAETANPAPETGASSVEADTTPEAEGAEDPAPEPATAETATAATPENETAAEADDEVMPATSEAKPEAEPEATVEAEPAADGEAPAAPAAPATPAADASAEAEPTAEAEAPAEADGQAAPAATTDDEPAEAEAAPAVDPEPVAAAPAAPAATKTEAPATAPATTTASAITPTDLASRAPGLVGAFAAAGEAIQAHGLAGQRAVVYLVLDRSGSMRGYFKDGTVSHLAEQALALSAQLDATGTVPVVFFSTDIDGTADLELDQHSGRIEELHGSLGHMGRTNYHTAVHAVIEHYKASGTTDPAFVIFQTDGAPTAKTAAEKALCEAAGLPLFWQFLAFGDPEAKGFDFLRKLDTSPALAVPEKRAVDNTGFFHAGLDPRTVADAELYREILKKFPGWLAAREQG